MRTAKSFNALSLLIVFFATFNMGAKKDIKKYAANKNPVVFYACLDGAEGSLVRNDHLSWASQRTLETLIANLKEKETKLFSCSSATNDRLTSCYAQAFVSIALWGASLNCLTGDQSNKDFKFHKDWAKSQPIQTVLNQLEYKSNRVLRYLSPTTGVRAEYFADISVILAKWAQ